MCIFYLYAKTNETSAPVGSLLVMTGRPPERPTNEHTDLRVHIEVTLAIMPKKSADENHICCWLQFRHMHLKSVMHGYARLSEVKLPYDPICPSVVLIGLS